MTRDRSQQLEGGRHLAFPAEYNNGVQGRVHRH